MEASCSIKWPRSGSLFVERVSVPVLVAKPPTIDERRTGPHRRDGRGDELRRLVVVVRWR
jgi:hypothetical protein